MPLKSVLLDEDTYNLKNHGSPISRWSLIYAVSKRKEGAKGGMTKNGRHFESHSSVSVSFCRCIGRREEVPIKTQPPLAPGAEIT